MSKQLHSSINITSIPIIIQNHKHNQIIRILKILGGDSNPIEIKQLLTNAPENERTTHRGYNTNHISKNISNVQPII